MKNQWLRRGFIVLVLLLGVYGLLRFVLIPAFSPRPQSVNNGSLAPCPDTPACVLSPPIAYSGTVEQARAALLQAVRDTGGNVIRVEENYIYAEYIVPFFGFIDDLEAVIEDDVIQIRSASRIGKNDFGVNRSRIEAVRARFRAILS